MSISRREARTVRVLGGSGAVSVVTLRHSNPYGDTMIYEVWMCCRRILNSFDEFKFIIL